LCNVRNTNHIAFFLRLLCIFCISSAMSLTVFGQKADSVKISIKPKPKVVSRVPVIRATVQPYRPSPIGFGIMSTNLPSTMSRQDNKILTVLKLYPNPVSDQLNLNLRLEKEAILSVKITDLLGNEIMSLMNEKAPAGEQTRTFTLPRKLNTGMYFVRIVAGGDPKVLKISVL